MRAATSPCFLQHKDIQHSLKVELKACTVNETTLKRLTTPKRKKRRRKDGSYSAVACMLPVPTVLLAVTNIQMTSLYGNLLTWSLLIGIQSYVLQRGEYCSE